MRRVACFAAAAISLLTGAGARAAVTLVPSRTDALYSTKADADCSKLSQLPDDQLPWNVVRIRAVVDGAPPEQISYRWSVQNPQVGTFAADQDLGSGQQAPAVQGICAEFGNACILSEDKLRFYSQPSILWIGPTCDTLPEKTRLPGNVGRLRFEARAGKRRLGKTTVSLGFGRIAAVKLFADGEDGDLRPGGVAVGFRPIFGAVTTTQFLLPELEGFEFGNGTGATAGSDGACRVNDIAFPECAGGRGGLDYPAPGRFLASVEQKFKDGSALCDHVKVQVLACNPSGEVSILRAPRLRTYIPGDPSRGTVDVRVRFTNRSRRRGSLPACRFALGGANVLSCTEDVDVGGTTDSKTTRFDLPHCSETESLGCQLDAQCRPPVCDECAQGEVCLTESHCSKTTSHPCTHDPDCAKPGCDTCNDDETCVHVLALGAPVVVLDPNQSIDLVVSRVPLLNLLPDTAHITDRWTVTTENNFTAETTDVYRIKGRPGLR